MSSKSKCHRVLLVEDNDGDAALAMAFLDVIGHEYVHVKSQASAIREIENGEFCYVLLDLEIYPRDSSLGAIPEAGHETATTIRNLRPQKTTHRAVADRAFVLPILVLSKQGGDIDVCQRLMKNGVVSGVLKKPLNRPGQDSKKVITDHLREAQRSDHEKCVLALKGAHGEQFNADPTWYPSSKSELEELIHSTTLLVDAKQERAYYRGHELSAHWEPQPRAVLTAIAMHPNVKCDEDLLNTMLLKWGLLGEDVGADFKTIRGRVVGTMRKSLVGTNVSSKEVGDLIRSSPKQGWMLLRMPSPGTARVIGAKMNVVV